MVDKKREVVVEWVAGGYRMVYSEEKKHHHRWKSTTNPLVRVCKKCVNIEYYTMCNWLNHWLDLPKNIRLK